MVNRLLRPVLKTQTSSGNDKLLGLEGLRFLATFAVLLWHYQHFAIVADRPVGFVASKMPFYSVFFPFYDAGRDGVWVFWCISGFIFFWKYRETIFNGTIDGRTFFVFRLSRLYPLHFATLMLVALLQPVYFATHGYFFVYQNNDIPHFLAQLFMASDWFVLRSDSFDGPIWSVSVEVLVYTCFFLTVRFAAVSLLLSLIVFIVSANVNAQVCSCLVFFYVGGLAALARQMTSRSRYRTSIEPAAWSAAAAIPVSIAIISSRFAIADWMCVLACTPILLFCLAGLNRLPPWLQRLLETSGNTTYSCYLLHFPIQLLIVLAFSLAQRPVPYRDHLFCSAFVLGTLLIAHLTYRYFEAPAQKMIRSSLLRKKEEAGLGERVRPRFDFPTPPAV